MATVTEPGAPEIVPEYDESANSENGADKAAAEAAARLAARKTNVTLEGQDFSEFSTVLPIRPDQTPRAYFDENLIEFANRTTIRRIKRIEMDGEIRHVLEPFIKVKTVAEAINRLGEIADYTNHNGKRPHLNSMLRIAINTVITSVFTAYFSDATKWKAVRTFTKQTGGTAEVLAFIENEEKLCKEMGFRNYFSNVIETRVEWLQQFLRQRIFEIMRCLDKENLPYDTGIIALVDKMTEKAKEAKPNPEIINNMEWQIYSGIKENDPLKAFRRLSFFLNGALDYSETAGGVRLMINDYCRLSKKPCYIPGATSLRDCKEIAVGLGIPGIDVNKTVAEVLPRFREAIINAAIWASISPDEITLFENKTARVLNPVVNQDYETSSHEEIDQQDTESEHHNQVVNQENIIEVEVVTVEETTVQGSLSNLTEKLEGDGTNTDERLITSGAMAELSGAENSAGEVVADQTISSDELLQRLQAIPSSFWTRVKEAWSRFFEIFKNNAMLDNLKSPIHRVSRMLKPASLYLNNMLTNLPENSEVILAKGMKAAMFASGINRVLHKHQDEAKIEVSLAQENSAAADERRRHFNLIRPAGIKINASKIFETAATAQLLAKEDQPDTEFSNESSRDRLIRLRVKRWQYWPSSVKDAESLRAKVEHSVNSEIMKTAGLLSQMKAETSTFGKFFGFFQSEKSRTAARAVASATVDFAFEQGLELKTVATLLNKERAQAKSLNIPTFRRIDGESARNYLIRLRRDITRATAASGIENPCENVERDINSEIMEKKAKLLEINTSTPFQDVQRTLIGIATSYLPSVDERRAFIENVKALEVKDDAWPREELQQLFEKFQYADAAEFILNSNPNPHDYSNATDIARKTARGILIQYDAPNVEALAQISSIRQEVVVDQSEENNT